MVFNTRMVQLGKCKDKDRHGTIVTFKPSEKFMGKCQMKGDDLLFWLNNIKHFLR